MTKDNKKRQWVLFTVDEILAVEPTKAEAIMNAQIRCIAPVTVKRLRSGAYELKSYGETRTRTFWVMTRQEAEREGVNDNG